MSAADPEEASFFGIVLDHACSALVPGVDFVFAVPYFPGNEIEWPAEDVWSAAPLPGDEEWSAIFFPGNFGVGDGEEPFSEEVEFVGDFEKILVDSLEFAPAEEAGIFVDSTVFAPEH